MGRVLQGKDSAGEDLEVGGDDCTASEQAEAWTAKIVFGKPPQFERTYDPVMKSCTAKVI